MRTTRRAGQATLEICFVITMAILALLLVKEVVQAAIAGRAKQTGDVFGNGLQYEPGVTTIN